MSEQKTDKPVVASVGTPEARGTASRLCRTLYLSIEGIYIDGHKGTSADAQRWIDEVSMQSRVLPMEDVTGTQAIQESGS